jgi:hypothetical protein
MASPRFWIALLSSDGHLRQRLPATLEAARPWHVAAFSRFEALATFLRVTPVEAVLLDAERPNPPLLETAQALRYDRRLASPIFRLIALAEADSAVPRQPTPGGFDAVLPRQALASRLIAGIDLALAPPPRRYPAASSAARRGASMPLPPVGGRQHSAEVIPLFAARSRRSGP